jgi:hypothetical protein
MPKPAISAAGGAIHAEGHKSRRAALGLFASASAFAMLPKVAMADADDTGLLALADEVAEVDRAFEGAVDRTAAAEIAFARVKPPRPVAPARPDISDEEWFKLLRQKTAEGREAAPSLESLAHDAAMAAWERDCERLREECGLAVAEDEEGETSNEVSAIRDHIAGTRATTLAGLVFKARYASSHYRGEYDVGVMTSLVNDLLALGGEIAISGDT